MKKISKSKPVKVCLPCSGLGSVQRGFESFARECFEALRDAPEIDITLFKGTGHSTQGEKRVWCLSRRGPLARRLGRWTRRDAYIIEQATFTLGLLPYLWREKPDVVFFSDGSVGNLLWRWKRLTRGRFQLLFSNGAPYGPPYSRWDGVQQLAPSFYDEALQQGELAKRLHLLPYGVRVSPDFEAPSLSEKFELRHRHGLPLDRPIVLCVAALNRSHKRIDYLIEEMAALPAPRPYLLILGQPDNETPAVLDLAKRKLDGDFLIKTVPAAQIGDFYRSADVFVLASLNEGFGRVFLEAMAHGLPCLAHDYALSRFVLGEHGYFGDFARQGELSTLITSVLSQTQTETEEERALASCARHEFVRQNFSWDQLRPRYIEMLTHYGPPAADQKDVR